jgi:hypothetical protein
LSSMSPNRGAEFLSENPIRFGKRAAAREAPGDEREPFGFPLIQGSKTPVIDRIC